MAHIKLEAREYSISEIMEWDEPEWLVEGFLEEESCIFISAQPKVGKSFFALRLAAAVSSGSDLFGHSAKEGKVLYLAAERAKLMKRRTKALKRRDVPLNEDNFKVWPDPIMFADHQEVRNFTKGLKQTPNLLIVDTLRRCNDGDERDNTHMGQWTKGIELFRDLTGAAVVVVHHDHRESYSVHGRKLESSFSGAGIILGNLDGYFSLRPQTNGTITIESEGSNELNEFHATTIIENVKFGMNRSTGIMVHVDSSGVIEQKPDLAALALNVLKAHPNITQKGWYELCLENETIMQWWPKLGQGTLSKIQKEHAAMIHEEGNPTHKQKPFLRLLEVA